MVAQDQGEKLVEFRPSRLRFGWEEREGAYRHNFERDLHGIVIWDAARNAADTILEMVARDRNPLQVLQMYDIAWSAKHVASNFNRIYGRNPSDPSSRHERVGSGSFLYTIVEDPNPDYIVWQNISGRIEFTNKSIARLKPHMRSITQTSHFRYNIHSSNSLIEFMRDAVLFLGLDRFQDELSRGFPHRHSAITLKQDMAGAGGWSNLAEMFGVMRYASNAVVLRGYEELRDAYLGEESQVDEIDILCDEIGSLSGAACASPISTNPRKSALETIICGERVKLDARSIGDGYYDARWQQNMLETAQWHEGGFPSLEPANYLFSLLYHSKMHKKKVKASYQQVLPGLAQQVGLPANLVQQASSDTVSARVLGGFMLANGYGLPTTRDHGVYHNKRFRAKLNAAVESDVGKGPLIRLRRAVRWRAERMSWVRHAVRQMRIIWRAISAPTTVNLHR